VLIGCGVWSLAAGFPDSQSRSGDPEETPRDQNRCCHSEEPQTNRKARSVGVDPRAAAGFLTEGFLSETAGAWSRWVWGKTEPVCKDTTY